MRSKGGAGAAGAGEPDGLGSEPTLPGPATADAHTLRAARGHGGQPAPAAQGAKVPGTRTLPDGALLAGRYRIRRFIARGGMGEVYEAHDTELDIIVALKTLGAGLSGDGGAEARFRREVLVARQVTHPNVCRVFDLGHHPDSGGSGVVFLTMELLSGEGLDQRLLRRGRLPDGEVRELARQLCAALQAAHSAGVVHRDFKSGNILLVPRGGSEEGVRAVVTDFGLAFAASAVRLTTTGVGAMSGTPAYMAPEQVEGRSEITSAADLYALGVVLFELVTGRLPFVADSAAATALMRLTRPPPAPRSVVPALDPIWDEVILRCLALAPADRFASASEVAVALLSARLPAVGPARPPALVPALAPALAPAPAPLPALASRLPGQRRWLLVGALGLATLVAAGLGWRTLAVRERPQAAEPPRPAVERVVSEVPAVQVIERVTPAVAPAVAAESARQARALLVRAAAALHRADLPAVDQALTAALALQPLPAPVQLDALTTRAVVFLQRGQVRQAEEALQRTLGVARRSVRSDHVGTALGNLAELAYVRGDSRQTQVFIRQQLAAYGSPQTSSEVARVLTREHLDAGGGKEARVAGTAALDRARTLGDKDDVLLARALLLRANALEYGAIDGQELTRLKSEVTQTGHGALVRWEVSLECARALLAVRPLSEAHRATARQLIAEVRRSLPPGLLFLGLQARLVELEALRASGQRDPARAATLAAEATSAGLGLIARQATALAR